MSRKTRIAGTDRSSAQGVDEDEDEDEGEQPGTEDDFETSDVGGPRALPP
jgi:hypothetical protein